eukprot:2775982-Karenia_brevis.AAC.1
MRPVDSGEGVDVHRPESEHLQCSHEKEKEGGVAPPSEERERGVAPPSERRERASPSAAKLE